MDIKIYDSSNVLISQLTQWDVNRVLTVSGVETTGSLNFHFFNQRRDKALVVPPSSHSGNSYTVSVPNLLLQDPFPLFLCIYEKAASGEEQKTIYTQRFHIAPRQMPEEYTYEENIDYVSWIELAAEARELLDNFAETLAEVQGYAESAGESAEAAETSATAAESSAERAYVSESQVKGFEQDIENLYNASFEIASASGDIVSFDDDTGDLPLRSLKVKLDTKQDLHGYDNPWPEGAGKNLLDISHLIGKATIKGVEFEARADGSIVVNGTPSSGNSELPLFPTENPLYLPAGEYKFSGTTGGSATKYRMYITGGGSSAFVNNNGDTSFVISDPTARVLIGITVFGGYTAEDVVFWPMLRRAAEADAAYAPYKNHCHIGGWTGITVVKNGENVLPDYFEQGTLSSGNPLDATSAVRSSDYFVMADGSYTLYGSSESATAVYGTVAFYDLADKTFLGYAGGGFSTLPLSFSIAADCYAKAVFRRANGLTPSELTVASIAIGNAETLESYQGQTYPVAWRDDFADTLYDVEIDAIKGDLTTTRFCGVLTGDETIQLSTTSGYRRFLIQSETQLGWPLTADVNSAISSHFKRVDTSSMSTQPWGAFSLSTDGYIILYDNYNTMPGVDYVERYLKAQYDAGTPVQICYEIEPETAQIHHTPIYTLKGRNTVFAYAENELGDESVSFEMSRFKAAMTNSELTRLALGAYCLDTAEGAIASFPDGADEIPVKSLVAKITPVQDLHGYDHPWPAGGGKNLADEATVSATGPSSMIVYNQQDGTISVSGSVTYAAGQIHVQLQAGVTYAFSAHVIQATAQTRFGLRGATGAQLIASDRNFATSESDLSFTFTPTEDMTGRITLFSAWDQANEETAIFSEIQCEVGSVPTTYAPYENLCPISGWTGVDAERTGKNLLKLPPLDRPSRYGVEYEIVEGVLSFSGTSTSASAPWVNSQHFSYELADNGPYPAGNYQISVDGFPTGVTSYTYIQLGIYHRDGTHEASVYLIRGNDTGSAITQISLLDGDKLALFLQIAKETTVDNTVHVSMTRAGESTDFEPYAGDTYPVNWQAEAGTVYDGEMELVSGDLTDKALIITFDGTEDGWSYSTASARFYLETLPNAIAKSTNGVNSIGLCTHYAVITNISGSQFYNVDMALAYSNSSIASNKALAVRDSRFTDIDSFKAMLAEQYAAGTPVQLVYLRDEDATYQLATTPIPTRKGANNIWADTGNVSVEYRADTKLYIDKRIAALSQ